MDESKAAASTALMVDGEPAGNTSKVYIKAHPAQLSFFGTGKVQGHMVPASQVSKRAMRCGLAIPVVLLFIIVALIITGLVYLIYYLASI